MPSQLGPVLVFAPHADDEVLGCFSFLDTDCHVVYFGIEDREYASRQDRIGEVQLSVAKLRFRWEALAHRVNFFEATALVPEIERIVAAIRPATVLIPQPSYNQDHRAVNDAAVTALRPHDRNWFVPRVLVFEQPDSILWHHGSEAEPNYYRPIDIEAKLHSYSLYASQVRGHRSPDLVRAIARLRGAQAGVEFAEGFTVKRMVEEM
jgi:LmbE family N-acetylglucosaminyl deacetylase